NTRQTWRSAATTLPDSLPHPALVPRKFTLDSRVEDGETVQPPAWHSVVAIVGREADEDGDRWAAAGRVASRRGERTGTAEDSGPESPSGPCEKLRRPEFG